MSFSGKINTILETIKSSKTTNLTTHFTDFFEVYPLLPRQEKKEVAEHFYYWVKANNTVPSPKEAFATYVLALNHFFHEEYGEALHLVNEAHQLFGEWNDENAEAVCSILTGSIYRSTGSLEIALKHLWTGYEQLKKSGIYSLNFLACSHQIGSIYLDMNHCEDALPLFKQMLVIAEIQKSAVWEMNALLGLSKAEMVLEHDLSVKKYLDTAQKIANETKNPAFIASTLTELAKYESRQFNPEAAEQLHKEALSIREDNRIVGGAVTNYLFLSEIYREQSRLEEGIEMLKKALDLAMSIDVKPKISQIHLRLSEIYEERGIAEKSLSHYKLFHEIRQQVEREDAAKTIKNARLVFEAEQTKIENEVIKQQKTEIEEKNRELQTTIDELKRTKIGKKAKAWTLAIAIVLFMIEEIILHSILHLLPEDNFYLSLVVKMSIIFMLKPIDSFVEHLLLKKIMMKKEDPAAVYSGVY